jgi:transposase-like protein
MDDTAARQYFTCPTQTYHRRYEALRAVIVDGRSQKAVADKFGFQHHSLRQLVYEFRRSLEAGATSEESPFFATVEKVVPSSPKRNR